MCYVLIFIYIYMMYMSIITHTCYTGTPTVGFSYEWLFRSDSGQNIAGTFILGDCLAYCRASVISGFCLLNGHYGGNQKCTHKFPNASSGNALLLLWTAALRSGIELKLGQLESFPREFQTGAVQSMRMTVETASGHLLCYMEMVGLQ